MSLVLIATWTGVVVAEESSIPIELSVLQNYVGVWDANAEVWPSGLEAKSIKFKGVETNRAFGKHWIASDFDSTFAGQVTKVHSIIGYDLDKKKMVATVIDDGPYSATMEGDYDTKSKSIRWVTKGKGLDGKPFEQRTVVTENSANERLLVLSTPNKTGKFVKFMSIKFTRRK